MLSALSLTAKDDESERERDSFVHSHEIHNFETVKPYKFDGSRSPYGNVTLLCSQVYTCQMEAASLRFIRGDFRHLRHFAVAT
jgi:hypothetical protein